MNATKAYTAGLLLVFLLPLAVPITQRLYEPLPPTYDAPGSQRSDEPMSSTVERLDDLIRRLPASRGLTVVCESLLYASPQGQRPASLFDDFFAADQVSRFDANGDGTNELVMIRDDAQGNPARFIAYDAFERDSILVIDLTLPDYAPIRNKRLQFQGFYDVLGEGIKAAFFGSDEGGVIVVDQEDPSELAYEFDATFRYYGINDFNGDEKMDILVGNTQERRVEIRTFYFEDEE